MSDAHGKAYVHEHWQIKTFHGILLAINTLEREVLVIRARGGSKTHDIMIICLYLAYSGYRVVYFCSKSSQTIQPKKYMHSIIDNCFLLYCIKKPLRQKYKELSVYFEGRGYLEIINLTDDKARSPRSDVVAYDEEAIADEAAYMAAESILDGSPLGFKIHGSTPVQGTKFHDNHDRLTDLGNTLGIPLVFSRSYDQINFLVNTPEKRARYAEKKRAQAPWFFDQENCCKFTLPTGAVFVNVIYENFPDLDLDPLIVSGLDWNPVAGHWLTGGQWTTNKLGFLVTHSFACAVGYTHELQLNAYDAIKKWCTYNRKLCAEDGGINIGYKKWFSGMLSKDRAKRDVSITWEEWDNQGVNKTQAAISLMPVTLYVDKHKFPDLTKQIKNQHWQEDTDRMLLEKNPADSPHGLEGLLHAVNPALTKEYGMRRFDWHK